MWDKATTKDDWSSRGEPHPWWDRYTNPGVASYPRFDLHQSTYAVLMMADQTPAWRETYSRIIDELANRYPTYWGAVDWLTQIGDDLERAKYPAAVMDRLPEAWRGRYNRVGWTANGVEPWGLQPDPLGGQGNLFYRGWLNVILSVYRYVSGDDKWEKPFKVIGYKDQEFEWTQRRIVERLEQHWTERPEGPNCENTKVWPSCLSQAGLGLYLYDKVSGTNANRVYQNWLGFCKDNFMGVSADGKLEWFTTYYDPLIKQKVTAAAGGGLGAALYMLPQHRELASFIYEAAVTQGRWNDPRAPLSNPSPQALIMARELGDHTTLARLSAAAEREYEPRFFGADDSRFGWWFQLKEQYPRGQRSALMMVSEVGRAGDWMRAFQAPHRDKFGAPTVQDVAFPALGIYLAWNDVAAGVLHVGTYAAAPDRRGLATSWRVTKLPNPSQAFVLCDGEPFTRFQAEGPDVIRIDGTIDAHRYQIFTGYRGEKSRSGDLGREPERQATLDGPSRVSKSGVSGVAALAGDAAHPASLPSCPCGGGHCV